MHYIWTVKNLNFKWILYLISVVIVVTVGIQIYWNYKNYQVNKSQLISTVQQVLDSSVDGYYEQLAKNSTVGFTFDQQMNSEFFAEEGTLDSIVKQIDLTNKNFGSLDSLELKPIEGVHIYRGSQADSLLEQGQFVTNRKVRSQFQVETHDHNLKDSIDLRHFQLLTSKVIISISSDTLKIKEMDSLVADKLVSRKLNLDFRLLYTAPDSTIYLSKSEGFRSPLEAYSKSSFLPGGSSLKMEFSNETREILKRSMTGILISFLLVLAVISSLFYLLKIIRNQKELAEVKNDLISNITHEFKTPISTIGVALESIQTFDMISNKEKTMSYLKMSEEQLKKLNTMVEKLLETATLDSDNLQLEKEDCDLVHMLNSLCDHYRITHPSKHFSFESRLDDAMVQADAFHFENAINNLLDNAVKYGGDKITISIERASSKELRISVSDNGTGIADSEKEKVFDKFYRIPKGNTHDVKGFGIGLFYTKTIIEKHGGKIFLDLKNKKTNFIITFPG